MIQIDDLNINFKLNTIQLFRCLEKNAEHRPYMEELLEHPFITQVPDNVSL